MVIPDYTRKYHSADPYFTYQVPFVPASHIINVNSNRIEETIMIETLYYKNRLGISQKNMNKPIFRRLKFLQKENTINLFTLFFSRHFITLLWIIFNPMSRPSTFTKHFHFELGCIYQEPLVGIECLIFCGTTVSCISFIKQTIVISW